MIEVKGPDGRIFKFPMGTAPGVIEETMAANYAGLVGGTDGAGDSEAGRAQARPRQWTPQPQSPPEHNDQYQGRDDRDDGAPRDGGALRLSMIGGAVALVGLLAAGAFWLGGRGGGDGAADAGAAAVPGASPSAAAGETVPLNPTELRQATVPTQIRTDSDAAATVERQLAAGAVVTVVGERAVGGQTWAQVRLDDATTRTGWVVGDHLAPLGGSMTLQGGPAQPMTTPPPGTQAGAVAPPPTGATLATGTPIPPTTYFIASREANVRSGPSPRMPALGKLTFGTPVVADQQAPFEDKIWIRVRANSGLTGWINSNLASLTMPGAPLDAPSPPPAPSRPPPAAQNDWRGGSAVNIRKLAASGFYVQVGAARSEFELQDLVNRMSGAEGCMGYAPSYYESELFSRSRAGMVISNYGPFPSRSEAQETVSRLRPCIPDTYIIRQP
jgi:SH3-like domain-containing protein